MFMTGLNNFNYWKLIVVLPSHKAYTLKQTNQNKAIDHKPETKKYDTNSRLLITLLILIRIIVINIIIIKSKENIYNILNFILKYVQLCYLLF